MTIRKVAEGAYFVPSYSEDTIASFQSGMTNQGISVLSTEDDDSVETLEVLSGQGERPFSGQDFYDAVRRVIRRL